MKKSVVFLCLLGIAGTTSCSTEEKSIDSTEAYAPMPQISREGYQQIWSEFRVGDASVLFYYSTPQEAATNGTEAVNYLANESRSDMSRIPGCTKVVSNVKISNGRALLTDFHYLDETRNIILESHIFNPQTGEYDIVNNSNPIEDADLGSCPEGWSSLAVCPHFLNDNDFANCLGDGQRNFISSNLTVVGSCVMLRVSVGNTATTMCGQTC